MARASSGKRGQPPKEPLIESNATAALNRLRGLYADVEQLDPDVYDDPRFDNVERDIQADIVEIFGEYSTEGTHWNHQIFHSNQPDYLQLEADDPAYIRNMQAGRKEGIKRTKVLLESLMKRVRQRIAEQTASAPAAAIRDARAAFAQLTIHPEILAACRAHFEGGQYRSAILDAGIALVEYVKRLAGGPNDKHGKPLDGTPLMQYVFGSAPPILKVNDLKTQTDQDEQQGMQFPLCQRD